jgi:hypothetical protein
MDIYLWTMFHRWPRFHFPFKYPPYSYDLMEYCPYRTVWTFVQSIVYTPMKTRRTCPFYHCWHISHGTV